MNLSASDTSDMLDIVQSDLFTDEGFRATAYWDSNGWAYGYGNHNRPDGSAVQEDDVIDQPTAIVLARATALGFWQTIAPFITVTLNINQCAALTELAYNWGPGNVQKSNLLSLINAGAGADQINAAWETSGVTSGGVYLSTLYQRRLRNESLFNTAIQFVQDNPGAVVATIAVVLALTGYYIYRVKKDFKRSA